MKNIRMWSEEHIHIETEKTCKQVRSNNTNERTNFQRWKTSFANYNIKEPKRTEEIKTHAARERM